MSTASDDLFERMRAIVAHNKGSLDRLDGILAQEEESKDSLFYDEKDAGRPDSRTVDDFLARLRQSQAKERAKNVVPLKKERAYR
jgi:hypothetical protein